MAYIQLDNVSVRFRSYHGKSSALKEFVMARIRPPSWKKSQQARSTFWGLKDINLRFDEGDRIGIIGPNGAGKSTLLKVISRIYRPTTGHFDLKGRVAPLIEIGAGFNLELSGEENVFLNGAILGIPKKVLREHVDSIFAFSGLQEFREMPVKYYSTGMHLRLAFSIATEITPDVLILDELYAGGDAEFIERANKRLHSVVDGAKIVLLVAHEFEYIKEFCSRVIVLDHGVVRFSGEPSDAIERYLAHTRGAPNAFV